jgi:hypothetical protein
MVRHVGHEHDARRAGGALRVEGLDAAGTIQSDPVKPSRCS